MSDKIDLIFSSELLLLDGSSSIGVLVSHSLNVGMIFLDHGINFYECYFAYTVKNNPFKNGILKNLSRGI